jgi:hypothetical protein
LRDFSKEKIAVLGGRDTHEVTLSSPSLHPLFGPAFTSCPLFQWYLQSKESLIRSQYEMLETQQLVNAQGSRVIIVVDQVGAVKIYVVWQQWRRSGKRRERG